MQPLEQNRELFKKGHPAVLGLGYGVPLHGFTHRNGYVTTNRGSPRRSSCATCAYFVSSTGAVRAKRGGISSSASRGGQRCLGAALPNDRRKLKTRSPLGHRVRGRRRVERFLPARD